MSSVGPTDIRVRDADPLRPLSPLRATAFPSTCCPIAERLVRRLRVAVTLIDRRRRGLVIPEAQASEAPTPLIHRGHHSLSKSAGALGGSYDHPREPKPRPR